MMIRAGFEPDLSIDVYGIEDGLSVALLARSSRREVYSWITYGRDNWLERGYHLCNVLGLVLLPPGLPDIVDLQPDAAGDDCG